MNEILMDANVASETYKFLNALLDDYTTCKTELARGGILKAYKMLLERASDDHLKQIEKIRQLEKELADTKAKLPKTKEEITKLLHEAGFHELEECEDEADSSFKTKTEDRDLGKQMTLEEVFGIDDSANEGEKNSKNTKKSLKKIKTSKSKTKNVAKNKNITKSKKL